MISYALVYTFLAIAMGDMVYVVGTPWVTPNPRKISWKRSRRDINTAHG